MPKRTAKRIVVPLKRTTKRIRRPSRSLPEGSIKRWGLLLSPIAVSGVEYDMEINSMSGSGVIATILHNYYQGEEAMSADELIIEDKPIQIPQVSVPPKLPKKPVIKDERFHRNAIRERLQKQKGKK